nr:hypothetical protein [Tanacetum cinerariifolium]
ALYVAPDTAGPSVPADKRKALMPDLDIPAEMNAMKEQKKRALADLRYRALQNKSMKKSEVTEFMRAFVKATVSATAVSAAPRFTDSTVITTAAMDSAVTRRQEFFFDSDEEMPPGVSRVAAEPDFDDEVIADPRVKLETVSESTSSPPLTRRKHLGERGEAFLCDRPVEDFFSSDSDSGDDDSEYSLPYSEFQDWEVVRCPPGNSYIHVYHREDRRRKYFTYLKELLPYVYPYDIHALCQKMNRHFRLNPDADDGLDLWRDDDWIVSSWTLYTKSTVHVLDLTNGKTVYMFMGSSYPIRATLLEQMLRHRLIVPPSYCRHVRVGGIVVGTMADTIIRTIQADPLQATMPIPVGVLFESTSMNLQEFFLGSNEEMPPGVSALLLSLIPMTKPVEDFFSSDSDSGDDDSVYSLSYNRRRKYFTYLKELLPHVYPHDIQALRRKMNRHFRLNPDADDGLDLWRDVNMFCRSLHADDVEEFWCDQDDWIMSSWTMYTKSTVHVLDLTNEKTVYMFMGSSYPFRATLLKRMLRHRLTVPPSYCRHVRVGGIVVGTMAGTIIRTVQADLLQATMPVSSAPMS